MFTKFRKSHPLPPLPPGYGDFWVMVHVKFAVPIPDEDDPTKTPAQGYYRTFGIRCPPSEVPTVIDQTVTDGAVDWSDTEWSLVDSAKLQRRVTKQIKGISPAGIWFESGRVLYADPDLEPPPS